MEKLWFALIVAGMVIILVGRFAYQKAKEAEIYKSAFENYQPKSYTKDEFYDVMLSLKKTENLVFTDFPKHLLPVVFASRGDTIFWSKKGDFILKERYPNAADTVNRYISYFIGDIEGNSWTIVRQPKDDKFHIYRMQIAESKE